MMYKNNRLHTRDITDYGILKSIEQSGVLETIVVLQEFIPRKLVMNKIKKMNMKGYLLPHKGVPKDLYLSETGKRYINTMDTDYANLIRYKSINDGTCNTIPENMIKHYNKTNEKFIMKHGASAVYIPEGSNKFVLSSMGKKLFKKLSREFNLDNCSLQMKDLHGIGDYTVERNSLNIIKYVFPYKVYKKALMKAFKKEVK